ncbi:MAG: hypothetical protein ACFFBP_00935 [Promethearchaeota archaeon]
MNLQECLASRKDCSGLGHPLALNDVKDICKSTQQAAFSRTLFFILPDGPDYKGGIYKYDNDELSLLTNQEKTNFTMEVYPELLWKEKIPLNELIRIGLTWQYLSLKAGNLKLGVSQRARKPKKYNKVINQLTNENHIFLYSVAVRERDKDILLEDKSDPLQIKIEEGTFILDIPDCYKNRAIYENLYKGTSLDDAIFNNVEVKSPNNSTLHELSQLLWACEGETDHATHGNRDLVEKNGYGRVHASGCAGNSVYPIVIVDELADLPKGSYIYNPVGYSVLNRWIRFNDEIFYDHFIQKFSSDDFKSEIEEEFNFKFSNYAILLCIDRKKPCSGFLHSKLLDVTYWSEIESGMALAGLQLQANGLGLKWQKLILPNPDDSKLRRLFRLDSAENTINNLASKLVNPAKNESLSLKSNLVPTVLFYLQ